MREKEKCSDKVLQRKREIEENELAKKDTKTHTHRENGRKGERKKERVRVPEGVRKRDNLH